MKKLMYLIIFLSMLLVACNYQSQPAAKDEVANIPDAGPPKCSFHDIEAYNLSLGSYKSLKKLTYYVANKPTYMDSAKANDIIDRAWEVWSEHLDGREVDRVDKKDSARILIYFQNMDGTGGMLGQSEYPPTDDTDDRQRSVIFDNYDVSGHQEGTATFDFFTIAVHEFGHTLGLMHCEQNDAVMFWQYNAIKHTLKIDDISGIRERYNPTAFKKWGKTYLYFYQDITGKASKDFKNDEFYTKCRYNTGHYLDSALVPAIQYIRTYFGVPVKIISSFRTYECNKQAGGAIKSQHMQYDAIDFKFMGRYGTIMHKRYMEDIKNKGVVFQALFKLGIRGFGTYATSNHIDGRVYGNMFYFKGAFYNVWGTANESALLAPDYYGVERCE